MAVDPSPGPPGREEPHVTEPEAMPEGQEAPPPGVRTMAVVRWALMGLMAVATWAHIAGLVARVARAATRCGFNVLLIALACAAPRAETTAVARPVASAELPAAAEGGEAWGQARWGMTVEEVLKALPGEAVRLDPELKLADGTVVAAGIDVHQIASHRFRVRFVFEAGTLSLVSLRTPPDWYAGPEVYAEVEKTLEERFGRPLEVTSDKEFIDLRQTRWIVGQSGVDVKYIPGVVAIVHYPRPASAPPAATPPASGATDR